MSPEIIFQVESLTPRAVMYKKIRKKVDLCFITNSLTDDCSLENHVFRFNISFRRFP